MNGFLLILLLGVAAAQAADWSNIRSVHVEVPDRQRPAPATSHGRIVGGGISEPHQFPYMAGIMMDFEKFCGGSLITRTAVLTAAHCTYTYTWFEIHLAAQNIMNEGEEGRQFFYSNRTSTHPEYNGTLVHHDIALIFIKDAFGVGIELLRLPSYSMVGQSFVNVTARVSGWGTVSDSNNYVSPELRYADVTVIANDICKRNFGDMIYGGKVCVANPGGTEGPCKGDSGGPLVMYEDDGLPTEIGLVSFGPVSCESSSPNAFTRVTFYLDWIEQNTEDINIRP